MARIRSIKPEFWSSEQVVECSPTARLLFIGLWNFCDDGGNHPASTKTLKMEVFPGDCFPDSAIKDMVDELLKNGLIIEYVVENKGYWHVTGWHHQKIEKPNKRYPPFQNPPNFGDLSPNGSRKVGDQTPEEGNGGDNRNGKEETPLPPADGGADDLGDQTDEPEPSATKPASFDPLTLPLPDCVPLAAWAEWIAYRRERRLSCRESTLRKQVDFLATVNKSGHSPVTIIEISIRNGWQGLFEPKGTVTPFTPQTPVRNARMVLQ